MEKKITFKEQYYIGLNLLKEDIEKCKADHLYSTIVQYFEYPLSLMEQEVKESIANNIDTEQYYMDKCKQIEEIYTRFAMSVAIVSKRFGPKTTRIKEKFSNTFSKILKPKNKI